MTKSKLLAVLLLVLGCVPRLQASPVRDLQRELGVGDPGWKVTKETDTTLMWMTPDQVVIALMICDDKAPGQNPHRLKQFQAYYREMASAGHGGLVEAEPHTADDMLFNLVTFKYPIGEMKSPPDDTPGYAYQVSAMIPTTKGTYMLQAMALDDRQKVTGTREAVGIIIYMKERGIRDVLTASKTFYRDPYDPAFNEGAKSAFSDERRFDKDFPDHPLSVSRAWMDALLKTWTIPERIQKIARFHEGKHKAGQPGP